MKKEYEILLFDLDDTLIDETENLKYAFKKVLNKMDIEYTDDDFKRWLDIDREFWEENACGKIEVPEEFNVPGIRGKWLCGERVLRYLDYSLDREEATNLYDYYMLSMRDYVVALPNVFETLKYLSKKYRLIIASNGPVVAAAEKLRKIGCLEFFEHIICSGTVHSVKPNLAFFEGIENIVGSINKDKCLMIGNSLTSDIEFAKRVGMDSCWYNSLNDKLVNGHNPTYTIKNIEELKEIL